MVRKGVCFSEFDTADHPSAAHHADGAKLCVVDNGGVTLEYAAGGQPQPRTRDGSRMAGRLQRDCHVAMAGLLRHKPLAVERDERVFVNSQVEQLGGARVAVPASYTSREGKGGGWAH